MWNLKSSLPAARQAHTLSAVVATLSQCLALDAGVLIPKLREEEEAHYASGEASADTGSQAVEGAADTVEMEEEEAVEDEGEKGAGHKTNKNRAVKDNDFTDLLPVSGVSPLCCRRK